MLRRFVMLIVLTLVACQSVAKTATSPSSTTTSFPTETPIPQPTATETITPVPTIPASSVELKGAEVPQGFSLIKFADLYRPTAFAFDAQGRMYVTSQDGNVYLLRNDDKDGRADSRMTFSSGYYFPLGVTVHVPTGDVYVSHQGKITVLSDTNGDDKADVQKNFAEGLPFNLHQNDNLKFGPDGWLYIGVGVSVSVAVGCGIGVSVGKDVVVEEGEVAVLATD